MLKIVDQVRRGFTWELVGFLFRYKVRGMFIILIDQLVWLRREGGTWVRRRVGSFFRHGEEASGGGLLMKENGFGCRGKGII